MATATLNRDAYRQAFDDLAGALATEERAPREAALQQFLELGLPDTAIEEWKYTDFARLGDEPVWLATTRRAPDLTAWLLADADARVWLNGARNDAQAPTLASTDPEPAHPGFAALNRAFARDGLALDLAADEQLQRPVQALIVSDTDRDGAMTHLHHRIRLGPGACATVFLQDLGFGEASRWQTQTLDIELADNAQLTLVRVQDETAATRSWFQATARVHAGARLEAVQVDFGGALIRNDWRIRLEAPGAHTALHGLFAPTGRSHVDNHTLIEHLAPHCSSREFFRGLAWERAKAVFNGKIVVHPHAQKTDSEQRLANLILSPKAEINAKPELEIFADDVKCAHGATFGRLDATALFYLRSRGVPEPAARALLTYSFADDALRHIPDEALRRAVSTRFLARIGGDLDMDALT